MYKTGDSCPICIKGNLSEKIITEEFDYKKHKISIPNYHIFSCKNCSEEVVSPQSIRATEKILTDFRRKIDGLLMSSEIKKIRNKLNMTQKDLASKLGVGVKTFARYENGQVTQSKAMDLLLKIINNNPSVLNDMDKHENLEYEVLSKPDVPCCESDYSDSTYKVKKKSYKGFVREAELAA
jgi:HTH-type transcriptional regulator/antitoxin MqsA